jgi:enoyl-CoA hydratase
MVLTYKEHYDGIDFEIKGHVAYLTFNNPRTLNSLSYGVFMSINEIFEAMTGDDDVWGVILTGAGRSFVAGADLSDQRMQGANLSGPVHTREVRRHIVHDSMRHVLDYERPVLAAINGYCLGGGAELAACCDFRIASTSAKIGYPEVRLGGIPAYIGVTQAMRIMSPANAREMLMTARHYTAAEAKELGFVSRVVEPEALMAEAENFMADIVQNAPIAVKYCKICADRGMEMSLDAGSEFECMIAAILATTEDSREGKAAFREKRPPVWKGR